MEPSNPVSYNENITPSDPAINGSQWNQQGDFVHQSSDGKNPRFIDSGFQNDFNQKSNFGQPAQQPTQTFPTFMPHQPDSNDSYCGRLFRNRRQVSSISGGLLLMINSGLHIGWGIWRSVFFGSWTLFLSSSLFIFIIMAWSVGAFLGGITGSILLPILRKNSIYYLSGAVMIVGNMLFIIWDMNGEAIAVGRLLVGIAHGIAYVTLITHAGENAASNMLGTILSIVNCMLYTGIFTSVIITGTVRFTWFGLPETISADRIVAILGVVLAVASIACTMMMTVESVPFLIRTNNHQNAMINLKHLRNASHDTLALTQEMEEFHLMTVQDKQNSWNIFTNRNANPLVLMILMRIMVALTNNFLINIITMSFAAQVFDTFQYRLVPLAVVAPRFAMSIVQIFYADILKRKIQIIASSALAAITLIITGIVLNTVRVSSIGQLWVVTVAIAVLWLFFQMACGIGMDQMQDVYLSEAFSTAKKRWSISLVAGIEHLFHIFMIGMYFVGILSTAHLYAIMFVTAVVVILLGCVFGLTLPETQNMSLKQARDSFINYAINITSPFAKN